MELQSLNPKQLLKEFKTTQKDMKSKDALQKEGALKKCADNTRYFTEGGCLVPLVLSIAPKKKTLDVSKLCLDNLLMFLEKKPIDAAAGAEPPLISALSSILHTEGHLEVLKVLSDALIFKEEFKKPKKKKAKKGEVVEEPPLPVEDPLYGSIRRTSLKCLYCIVKTLYCLSTDTAKTLQSNVASVEDIAPRLCELLLTIKTSFTHENSSVRLAAIQDGAYALMTLVFVLRHNKASATWFCSSDASLVLHDVAGTAQPFALPCMQIFEILSQFPEGVRFCGSTERQTALVDLLQHATNKLSELQADASAATAAVQAKDAKKDPKKDDKTKKPDEAASASSAVDPLAGLDLIRIDPARSSLAVVKLISKVFIAVGSQVDAAMELPTVTLLGSLVSRTIANPMAYKVMREKDSQLLPPLDESLDDAVDVLGILCGTLALVSDEVRDATCSSGALAALLKLLMDSKGVVTGSAADLGSVPAPVPVTGKGGAATTPAVVPVESTPPLVGDDLKRQKQRISQLRKVSEKAILNLLTAPVVGEPQKDRGGDSDSSRASLPVRWKSCASFKSSTGGAFDNPQEVPLKSSLLSFIGAAEKDRDLASRGVRIIAALLHSHIDPIELSSSIELHKPLIPLIAAFIDQCAADIIDAQLLKDRSATTTTTTTEASIEDIPPNDEKDNSSGALGPTDSESLYLALSVTELLLLSSPDAINSFTSAARVEVLADILKAAGPINNPVNNLGSSIGKSSIIHPKQAEFSVSIDDPRLHDWTSVSSAVVGESALLRPLVLDLLSSIAAAGLKYRQHDDAALPAAPCQPMSPSVSPCEEASLIVCKFASDVCCSVLLSQTSLQWMASGSLSVHPSSMSSNSSSSSLVPSVQDSALALLLSISSCGARGVAGALESIASSGFSYITSSHTMDLLDDQLDSKAVKKEILSSRFAMKDLISTLSELSESSSSSSSIGALVAADTAWRRPVLFSDVFPSNCEGIVTCRDSILRYPQVWPIVTFCSAFLGTLSNPKTTPSSLSLTIDALSAATHLSVLEDHSQPVLTDLVAAVFLSIGGGIAMSGLLGRFSDLDSAKKLESIGFARYLFSRGICRQQFWSAWEQAHRVEEVVDSKTGKAAVVPKKDDKKGKEDKKGKDDKKGKEDKGKGGGEVKPVSVVAEVQLNLESTRDFPDPNQGPSEGFWLQLLEVIADDLHQRSPSSTLLTSLTQGCLSDLAQYVISLGVDVDRSDGSLHTALMYCLLWGDVATVQVLLPKAGLDMLDGQRSPSLKYALMTIKREDMDKYFNGHNGDESLPVIELLGRPSLLPLMLQTKIDVNVCDAGGLSAIMMALGRGEIRARMGGYPMSIRNEAYNSSQYTFDEVHQCIDQLLSAGAKVNLCNVGGQVPLHIAAAKGDLRLLRVLIGQGAVTSPVDDWGYLPMHYLAACCPDNSAACFDLLVEHSVYRHVERMEYMDIRTGLKEEQKDEAEVAMFVKRAFKDSAAPPVIVNRRLNPVELFGFRAASSNLNVFQLCLSSHVVLRDSSPQLQPFLELNKGNRMKFALHLISCGASLDSSDSYCGMFSYVDDKGLTCLHAASLLFQGVTPQMYLTEREKKAKRVRKFVSDEAQIMDALLAVEQVRRRVNDLCSHPLIVVGPGIEIDAWTPVHAAILFDNPVMLDSLLQIGFDLDRSTVVHFLASHCSKSSLTINTMVIEAAANSSSYRTLLNDSAGFEARPLHLAVRAGNANTIAALCSCVKVELNAVDEATGTTAFYEASVTSPNSLALMEAFRPGSDRLDLFAGLDSSSGGRSPLNVALESQRVDMLELLVSMRRNDVIQQLLQLPPPTSRLDGALINDDDDEGEGEEEEHDSRELTARTLLFAVEQENADLVKLLGLPKDASAIAAEESLNQLTDKVSVLKIEDPDSDHIDENEPHEDEAMGGELDDSHDDIDIAVEVRVEASATGPVDQLDADTRRELSARLMRSNDVLRVVIPLVNSSGIVTEADHYSAQYFRCELIDPDTHSS